MTILRALGTAKSVVGIDWTGRELRWVALSGRADAWRVTAYGSHPCVLGDLSDGPQRAKIAAWLTGTVRAHRLRGARAVLAVPSERVLVRYMAVPRLPGPALRQAMEVELGSTLHVPFEHPVLDVVPVAPLGQEPEADDADQMACIVVTDRDLVERLSGVVSQAGLKPVAAEIAPLGLWRLATPNVSPDELTLWLYVDEGLVTSAVYLGEYLYVLRTIADQDRIRVLDADLEYLVNDLAYEAERVVNFFNFTLAGREYSLAGVWLHAVNHAESIAEHMAERLQRPVHIIRPVSPSDPATLERAFYVAAGLALRGFGST